MQTNTNENKTDFFSRWYCKDRRYKIRGKGSPNSYTYKSPSCQWSRTYTHLPTDYECVLTYCDNATTSPNVPFNYNFTWDQKVIPLGAIVDYPCQDGLALENRTEYKYQADNSSLVHCGPDGLLLYPSPWPLCSSTVSCLEPGNSPGVNRSYVAGSDLGYNSILEYKCEDPRMYISNITGGALVSDLRTRCAWKKKYDLDGSKLNCRIHHCAHPYDHPGAHNPPPGENDIDLVLPPGWTVDSWHVAFKDHIVYRCSGTRHIENTEVDPTQTEIEVECLETLGVYNTPENWPNCTDTVLCGQPPAKPTNGRVNGLPGFEGAIRWLGGAPDLQDTYNTWVEYTCADGSQFDTASGLEVSLRTRCQWDKQWAPYHTSLPRCKITHCVQPFLIPEDSFLEEVTSSWTPVGKDKDYRCQGTKADGTHTMFWETDRSKSTFKIRCLEDGTFNFKDLRTNWPTCLEGV